MPFASGAFAYTIIDEVLTAAGDPAAVAAELARVSPRGFVQVPSRASELVFGGPRDRWLVDLEEDGTLVFATKEGEPPGAADASAAFDESLLIRLGWAAHRSRWRHSVAWEDSLTVNVTGPAGPRVAPEVDLERVQAHLEEENRRGHLPFMAPEIMDLLRCPASGGTLTRRGRWMDCAQAGLSYPVVGPVPLLPPPPGRCERAQRLTAPGDRTPSVLHLRALRCYRARRNCGRCPGRTGGRSGRCARNRSS